MDNILKYQNPSSPLLKPWKALEKMKYEAIPDSTFTRDKTGIGSIEYFSADNNNGITYLNGYHKAHPKPGTDVILYDPATNDQQDVRLDALHFMPKDPIYGALYDEYLLAARDGDIAYNADRLLQEYIDSDKLEQAFKTYDVKNISELRERLFLNEADGLLRNMFIEGTPEYIKSKRYYPDKTQLEQWNVHLMPYINNIKTYLETGVKPEHVIEPAVVTAYKKGGRIHIKKKNRGKFTEYCGGKVTEECIARGKRSKNPLTRRRANFASVSRKWKHENGGILKAQEGTGNLLTPHPLSPVGIALNQARAMAKGNKNQQHLPPGVKEVIGPDGKKVAIRIEQPLVPLEQSIAEWLPGTGDITEVGYIANDVKNGNYGSAALAAAMIALPGNARKILDKFGVDLGDISTFKRLSDQEWDDMYFQAIDSGDMDLVQTIRDAHFKVKATGASIDANGNLIKTYRGQYPKQKYKEHNLNPFSDKRDTHGSSGYFSSTSSQIADTYVQPGGDKFELYTNFTNPSVVDAKGKGYKIAVSQVEPDGRVVGIQTDAYVNKAFGQGHDGVIIKNVKDASVGNNLNDLEKIADDYVGAAGRSKLADPITREFDIFTGNYEIIPISRRDNFNMSDIRYGFAPMILGLSAAKAVSNNSNTKEQQ